MKLGVLFFLFLTAIVIWTVLLNNEKRLLTVAFLDVGQGDAVYIEAPNGNQMLVDSGSGPVVLRELGKVMPLYDRSIDVLVATHPDKDHIGGLPDVLRHYKVNLLLRSGAKNVTGVFKELNLLSQKESIQKILARRGMVIRFGGGVYAEILSPFRIVPFADSNDASVVIRLVYGGTEFMLTGDAPQKIERNLVSKYGKHLRSNVLKAGHHGSKTSSAISFIKSVSPNYVVISAGKNNRYGHPHKETLARLAQFDASVLNTAKEGTIIFTSDGEAVLYKK